MKLEVGQKLWFSAPRYSTSRHVEITKVGREYVYINHGSPNDRFKLIDDRMRICSQGGSFSGRCYLSKDEFDSELNAEKLWCSLRNSCSYSLPHGATAESIREAARILGIELKEDGQ